MIVTLNSLIINWKSEQVLFKVYKVCMNDNDTHNYNFVTSKCSIIITLLNRLNCNYRKKDSSLSRFVSVINYKWSILKEFVTKMGLGKRMPSQIGVTYQRRNKHHLLHRITRVNMYTYFQYNLQYIFDLIYSDLLPHQFFLLFF